MYCLCCLLLSINVLSWLLQLYARPHQFAADLLIGSLQVRRDASRNSYIMLPHDAAEDGPFGELMKDSSRVRPTPAAAAAAASSAGSGRGTAAAGVRRARSVSA